MTTRWILDWPVRQGPKPVTTALNQAILRAVAEAARDQHADAVSSFLARLDAVCSSSGTWRREYPLVLEQLIRIQASASPETVVLMCRAGLECASSSFVMRTDDNNTTSIAEAMASIPTETLESHVYTGPTSSSISKDQHLVFALASPHGTDAKPDWISGDQAISQLQAWCDYGCMEESALRHASTVCLSNNVSEFVQNKIFCLLGVTSEMGPAQHLLKIPGACVLGVARAGPKLEALTDWVSQHGATDATLHILPANLLEQMIDIARWIVETASAVSSATAMGTTGTTLVLMPLAYMDGEANVRVTVAMDAIVQYVIQNYHDVPAGRSVALAYLTSPTTIYTIPTDAALEAQCRYQRKQESLSSWWLSSLVPVVSLGKWGQPSNTWLQLTGHPDDEEATIEPKRVIFNGVHTLQGPNYCLAKLMQQWRCIVARYQDRLTVCAPYAPPTRTESVRHNTQAAAALEGLPYIAPLVTFDVQPCSSLLTAILLGQLSSFALDSSTDQDSSMRSAPPPHPLAMFWDGSVHGGSWRCPYKIDSLATLTYILGRTVAQPGWWPSAALASRDTVASTP
jgi:hypothetical protein